MYSIHYILYVIFSEYYSKISIDSYFEFVEYLIYR